MFCSVLGCSVVGCSVIGCSVLGCSVIGCSVVGCSVLGCSVVGCSVVCCEGVEVIMFCPCVENIHFLRSSVVGRASTMQWLGQVRSG